MNRSNSRIFSFNAIAITIGVLGGVSSIITVFFTSEDLNARINGKWLVLVCYLALTILLILSKAIYDLRTKNRTLSRSPSQGFSPIKYIEKDRAFVVSKINELSYDSVVSLHMLADNYEKCIGFGRVVNVQERLMQIEVIQFTQDFQTNYIAAYEKICSNNIDSLKQLTIRSSVPYDLIRS